MHMYICVRQNGVNLGMDNFMNLNFSNYNSHFSFQDIIPIFMFKF